MDKEGGGEIKAGQGEGISIFISRRFGGGGGIKFFYQE